MDLARHFLCSASSHLTEPRGCLAEWVSRATDSLLGEFWTPALTCWSHELEPHGKPHAQLFAKLAASPTPSTPGAPARGRMKEGLPVNALVIIVSVKELDLLKSLRAGVVTAQVRVHPQEQVEGCRPFKRKGTRAAVGGTAVTTLRLSEPDNVPSPLCHRLPHAWPFGAPSSGSRSSPAQVGFAVLQGRDGGSRTQLEEQYQLRPAQSSKANRRVRRMQGGTCWPPDGEPDNPPHKEKRHERCNSTAEAEMRALGSAASASLVLCCAARWRGTGVPVF